MGLVLRFSSSPVLRFLVLIGCQAAPGLLRAAILKKGETTARCRIGLGLCQRAIKRLANIGFSLAGQVIKLQPRDVLVLSYLKSCEHETITGGTVRIGADKSEVEGGKVARTKLRCNGNMQLSSAETNASAATPCQVGPKCQAASALSMAAASSTSG